MLDIDYIRGNIAVVKKAIADKGLNTDIDRLLTLDSEIRILSTGIDILRCERNTLTKEIAAAGEKTEEKKSRVRQIKTELDGKEPTLSALRHEYNYLMLKVPSIPSADTPIGKDEGDNVEIRRWGELPKFHFQPKNHMELAESLDIVDVPRAVKFAGSRSYFLKNEGMLLEMAVLRFALDTLLKKGFTPMTVPVMVKESAMLGTGYFPTGYDQAYKLPEDDLYLVGTSEVSLIFCRQNEILDLKELPLKYAGYSTCFRREAGTYGKDTKGLYRVHQFQKVEQVVLCKSDEEEAQRLHYELLGNTEEILRALRLPYRVVSVCTGDMGIGKVRMHDVETFMPSRGGYCETHSCSTLGEFQSRRSNIRYRDTDGTLKYPYTLNNTGIASPRILIPLLEMNQQEDGSVKVPDALLPYMNGITIIKSKK